MGEDCAQGQCVVFSDCIAGFFYSEFLTFVLKLS